MVLVPPRLFKPPIAPGSAILYQICLGRINSDISIGWPPQTIVMAKFASKLPLWYPIELEYTAHPQPEYRNANLHPCFERTINSRVIKYPCSSIRLAYCSFTLRNTEQCCNRFEVLAVHCVWEGGDSAHIHRIAGSNLHFSWFPFQFLFWLKVFAIVSTA